MHLNNKPFLSLWFQKDGFRQFDLFWSHCWKGTWKTYHIVWEPSVILLLNWAWWTYSFSPSEFSSLVWIASSLFNIFYMIGSLLGSIIYTSSLDITGFMKRMFFRKLIIWTISLNLKKLFRLKNLFLFQILNVPMDDVQETRHSYALRTRWLKRDDDYNDEGKSLLLYS